MVSFFGILYLDHVDNGALDIGGPGLLIGMELKFRNNSVLVVEADGEQQKLFVFLLELTLLELVHRNVLRRGRRNIPAFLKGDFGLAELETADLEKLQ